MGEHCIVYITSASKEEAETIGEGLVRERLAACVQISSPIVSIYQWKGEICRESEYRITVKSRRDLYPLIETYVRENHSYEVPQLVSVNIDKGSADYLHWIEDSVKTNNNNKP